MPIISLMALRACSCIGIIVLLSVRTIQKPKIFYRSDDILVYSDQTSTASKSLDNMLQVQRKNWQYGRIYYWQYIRMLTPILTMGTLEMSVAKWRHTVWWPVPSPYDGSSPCPYNVNAAPAPSTPLLTTTFWLPRKCPNFQPQAAQEWNYDDRRNF